jgi:pantoate--beta-alanine ligase
MKILENKKKLDVFLSNIREKNHKIGLIPTMGSIHEGHLSLVEKSKNINCFSLATIFINPTQFNDQEDFRQYPQKRNLDIARLEQIQCDALYFPQTEELYPNGIISQKTIFDYRDILCDKFRPGHFDGVTTVVKSLFDIIKPDHAFFGEKDFQQLKLIQKIVEKEKLPILIHPCNSVRMLNGISFSSRYKNLQSSQEKIFDKAANKIINSVLELKKKIDVKILENLKEELIKINIKKIDYLEIRDEINLLPTVKNKKARLFAAFYIDDIRIIDNFVLY